MLYARTYIKRDNPRQQTQIDNKNKTKKKNKENKKQTKMTQLFIDVPVPPTGPPTIIINSGDAPTTLVELALAAQDLINADVLSKSDPFCIIRMKESYQDKFCEIGRTEKIKDNLNPQWVKKFLINYNFESTQKIRFEVWDQDPNGNDFLGSFETTLADIVANNTGRQFRGKMNLVF